MYSSERNVQILLALLKAHSVEYMVVSPGSANASFVASAQNDKSFKIYSSVDERSAAYIACGLSEELQKPVAICCTGATASRNYVPALTEAFYRKLPIIAITATRPINMIGQNRDQIIDRTTIMNDIAVKSVHIPVVNSEEDEWEANLKINDALLGMNRWGKGPVHINLTTSYSLDFSVLKLPEARVIMRHKLNQSMPQMCNGKMGIFVGTHSIWSEELTIEIDKFCRKYDCIVFCDQTSNYRGKYAIPCGIFDIAGFPGESLEYLIHIGNISASWPAYADYIWRVNPDGEIRDTYKRLIKVFEMEELEFFRYYNSCEDVRKFKEFEKWNNYYDSLLKKIKTADDIFPFSSFWIAQNLYERMPKGCTMHFGILNSLRCWNCFKLDNSITGFSNTGGFGIDGGVSSLIGASLANPEKLYFGIFGDLAFFYDMNSLGNRHIGTNIRLMVVNNGLGGEFKNSLSNVQRAGLGDSANEYIAAYGHYGMKSCKLVQHYSEDLGFQYLTASNKNDFRNNMEIFCSADKNNKPILFEVFIDERDDVEALDILIKIGADTSQGIKNKMIGSIKKVAKGILR